MYNYCVVFKCRAEDEGINTEFASACDSGASCKPHVRQGMLREFKAIEESIRDLYGFVDKIRLSTYDYVGEHPTEFQKGQFGFVVADLLIGGGLNDLSMLDGVVGSIIIGIVTYVGSILLSKVDVSVLRVVYRRGVEDGYRLYEEKHAESDFRYEEFKPKRSKCSIC